MAFFFNYQETTSEKAGLPPGTAVYVGEERTGPIKVTLTDYDRDNYTSLAELDEDNLKHLATTSSCTWLNIDGIHDVELIKKVGDIFNLHSLTVEDILNTRQRAKVEIYDNYIYFVARLPEFDEENKQVTLEQVSFILTDHVLLTFQEKESNAFNEVRKRIATGKGRIRKMCVDYLTYALLDSVVDNFFVVLENMGEELEELEEELLENPQPSTLHRIHLMKREMILLRKAVWPLREMIGTIQRDEVTFLGQEISFYLRDLYDHTVQVMETVETFRDIISGMLDIYLSSVSHRTNEVMKVLTIFAAIFIPLTFIAGLYGMNFNTAKSPFNMPELNWAYGYPFALGLMAAVTIGMVIFFKRNKWF